MAWQAFLTFHVEYRYNEETESSGPPEEGADGWQQLHHGWGDAASDLKDALEAVLFEFDALDYEC
eukprot:7617749-Lingulodinium_polyedra.AAC.1